jgi:DNA-directed RNA polymerase beta subunit
MQKKVILGPHATVEKICKVGDNVKVGDDLIVYEQSNEEETMNKMLANIGTELKEDIRAMGKSSLKSKYTGVVEEIKLYSTMEPKDLSPSLGKIVKDYWKHIKDKKAYIKKYKIEDPSMQGNTFFEVDGVIEPDSTGKVKGYKIDDGVIIEFYIKFEDPVGVGDKLCDFAALKGVTAVVIPKGKEPYTLDRPNEEIGTCFPSSSVCAMLIPNFMTI